MEKKLFKNYIIQAHKNPYQLKRLVDKLNDNISSFYIHIDLKSEIEPFENILTYKNVFFIKERVNCIWGDYSQVIPTLNLIKNVINTNNEGPIIFLSGQDYPIKSLNHINEFLTKNIEFDLIEYDNFTEPISPDQPEFYDRIEKYKVGFSDKRGDFTFIAPLVKSNFRNYLSYFNYILKRKIKLADFIFKYRNHRNSNLIREHFRGPNWWCLSFNTAKKIFQYYQTNNIELNNYYRYTYCADEQFFHTILKEIMKSDKSIKVKNYIHYTDFSRIDVPVPVTFTKEDIAILISQPEDKLFARKFDLDIDSAILDLIDDNTV